MSASVIGEIAPRADIESISAGVSREYSNAIVFCSPAVKIKKAYGTVLGTRMTLSEIQEFVARWLPGTTIISLEAGEYAAVDGIVVSNSNPLEFKVDYLGSQSTRICSSEEQVAKALMILSKDVGLLDGAINSISRVWRSRYIKLDATTKSDFYVANLTRQERVFFKDEEPTSIPKEELERRMTLIRKTPGPIIF